MVETVGSTSSGELRFCRTGDGSISLHSSDFEEGFHDRAGALNEAMTKFCLPAELSRFSAEKPVRVLDVCVGLGYNTAALLKNLSEPLRHVQWWGLELDRRPLELALRHPDFRSCWPEVVLRRLEAIRDAGQWQSGGGSGRMYWGDARTTLSNFPCKHHPFWGIR